ncbi:MAG: MFS transporter [Flavobacteriales bacterium]|nr:MFS transporter [Flavobacteriales bacterium]
MLEKSNKKTINAWAFYDWANSSYPLVITTAIFPIFYEAITTSTLANGTSSDEVLFFGRHYINTALISYVSAFMFLLVSVLIPLLSGIADYMGNKKSFLKGFCYLGAFSCILLYFFDVRFLELGILTYIMAGIGFWGSLVFYNAYLPEIAHESEHDRISAKGYALGYIGSALLLIVCLVFILTETLPAKWAFVFTGIWWLGFAQYTFMHLPNGGAKTVVKEKLLLKGFNELKNVWKQIQNNTVLKRYLRAFFVYSMSVQTIMLMAVYFGTKEITWPKEDDAKTGLIISVLLIQFLAIPGAYGLSWLSSKIGNIKALVFVVFCWIVICISALWVYTPNQFYGIAAAVGLVMGGIQSLSRSTYSKLLPETKDTSSYFSFYDVSEKIGIVVGVFAYGFIEELTGSMRNSIFLLAAFFALGIALLLFIPREKKK